MLLLWCWVLGTKCFLPCRKTPFNSRAMLRADIFFIACVSSTSVIGVGGEPVGRGCVGIASFWASGHKAHETLPRILKYNVSVIIGSLAHNLWSSPWVAVKGIYDFVCHALVLAVFMRRCRVLTRSLYCRCSSSSLTYQCFLLRARWYCQLADEQAFLEYSISGDH